MANNIGNNNSRTDGRVRHSPSYSSSSSSSSDTSPDFILYSQREEWSDVKPLPQEDGPHSVVTIAYSQRFRDTFDYFRAVLANNELSERALQLTADCASLNPSNYTIWYFRRLIIDELKRDLFEELKYIESVIIDNPKNYQVWHHRKCVVESIKQSALNVDLGAEGDVLSIDLNNSEKLQNVAEDEKTFVAFMISQDSKNYHAWQHRQWIVSEFNGWKGEIEYTNELIEDDIRNNSAWNHRYYVISNTTGFAGDSLESEILYTCSRIKLTPNNESSWNYLRGILSKTGLNNSQNVNNMCEALFKNPETKSSHLLGFMVDKIEEILSSQSSPDKDLLEKALSLCEELSNKTDIIRKEYWNYIARELKDNYAN